MAAWLSRLIVAGVILAAAHPAFADGPNFADLLARAKAQAAAGHRWAPSGDNMTETVSAMMALISSATPEQLAELSDLLEGDAKRLPHPAAKSEAVSEPASPAAVAEPDQADEKPDVPPLNSEPDRPVDDPLRRQPGLSWTGLWNTPLGRRQPRSQLGRSNDPLRRSRGLSWTGLWSDPLCRRRGPSQPLHRRRRPSRIGLWLGLLCRQRPRSQIGVSRDRACRRWRRSRSGPLQDRVPPRRACRALERRICLVGASRLSS